MQRNSIAILVAIFVTTNLHRRVPSRPSFAPKETLDHRHASTITNVESPPEIGSERYFQTLCNGLERTWIPFFDYDANSTEALSSSFDVENEALRARLDCHHQQKKPDNKTINFFSFADGAFYTDLLPLYAFYALSSHGKHKGVVEMVLQEDLDDNTFISRHASSLQFLLDQFGEDSVCVRALEKSRTLNRTRVPNTWRFLEVPVVRATYTYIGDIDVFLLKSVIDQGRLDQMEHWNLPYSNVIRPKTTRLTGLILVRTAEYYSEKLLAAMESVTVAAKNDEKVLYEIAAQAHGLPGTNASDFFATYRPSHGLHLSGNRGPGKRMCLPEFTSMGLWCRFFGVPSLSEFLHVSPIALTRLQEMFDRVVLQMKGQMKVRKNGKSSICAAE